MSKTWFSFVISKDKRIPETIARNSTIPEELGRISYIFSDKTGTLTKNEMIFKNIALETEILGEENFEDLKNILLDECKLYDAPLMDAIDNNDSNINNESNNENIIINTSENNNNNIISTSLNTNKAQKKKKKRTFQNNPRRNNSNGFM